jgi:WD40 repeat protein
MYRCSACGCLWDDTRALDNELTCTRRCGGVLVAVTPVGHQDLDGFDLSRLPYPVALTALRLVESLRASGDVLKTLFLVKDCFEATVKYLGAVLLSEYRHCRARTPERTEVLLKTLVRPSLGAWVSDVVRPLSLWLHDAPPEPGPAVAALFAQSPAKPGGRLAESPLLEWCKQFVTYRNDALGHGARRSDSAYADDLARWLPSLRQLLDGVAGTNPWRLCLATDEDRCQVWLGPRPGTATEPGAFSREQIGRFTLCGPGGGALDLYPFLCYLPDPRQESRLHFYDSLYRYQATRKEATVLEYDHGERHPRAEPAVGLEDAFTADLLAKAFKWHRGRMEVIEGRVANFGELIEAHASIVGRRFAVDRVRRFLAEHDRGLLVIEAQPGKGKTALIAHLVEEVFGAHAPRPVHFFYRRTAGITNPDVCVRSLYHALLEAHDITEADASKQRNTPEEVFTKLTNLLSREIAPRLLPGRPQLLFVDALDEADASGFQRIPENLPAGVYVIATTRPVADRTELARRQGIHWFDLDAPDLVQENLRDGFEYVQRELVGMVLPNETLDELSRIGSGNFLVLKLMCQQIRSALRPDGVSAFLRSLATAKGKNQLGFIYAEFWQRLTNRCTRDEVLLLCDMAGVLVTARAPLTAGMVCGVLGLRAGDWDFALRHLGEYLTAVEHEEDGVRETFYRVYHESFADFLRAKVATDRQRLGDRLAEYCEGWSRLPEGYDRTYGLRFAVEHLLEARRWGRCTALLTDLAFLEAKTAAGMVFDLACDYSSAVEHFPPDSADLRLVRLLEEALRRDVHFIHGHRFDYPQGLFQCLWNSCWWYDSPEAAGRYYLTGDDGAQPPPWEGKGAKLFAVLEVWRKERERLHPGFVWVRSLRPPAVHLGTGLLATLKGHSGPVRSVSWSPTGRHIASVSEDGTGRIWDAAGGAELCKLRGGADDKTCLSWSPDGRRLAGGSGRYPRIWDALDGTKILELNRHGDEVWLVSWFEGAYRRGALAGTDFSHDEVRSVSWSPDGRLLASQEKGGRVYVWDACNGIALVAIWHDRGGANTVSWSPDGLLLAIGYERSPARLHAIGDELRLAGLSASVSGNRSAAFWDGRRARRWYGAPGCSPTPSMVSWSPNGRSLAIVAGFSLIILDSATDCPRCVASWSYGAAGTGGASWSPDGSSLASWSRYNVIDVWDASDGSKRLQLQVQQEDEITSVSWSPDSRRLVSGSTSGVLQVWDARGGASLRGLRGHARWVLCVQWSPDGRRLATGGWDQTIRIWDGRSGNELLCLRKHAHPVQSVAWSPDGRYITGKSPNDATEYVWDSRDGAALLVIRGSAGRESSIHWSPQGQNLPAEGEGVARWDIRTDGPLAPLLTPEGLGTPPSPRRLAYDARPLLGTPLPPDQLVYDAKPPAAETVIESGTTGEAVAWLAEAVEGLTSEPCGRNWAGMVLDYLCLFRIETGREADENRAKEPPSPQRAANAQPAQAPKAVPDFPRARSYCNGCGIRLPDNIGRNRCPECSAVYVEGLDQTGVECGRCGNFMPFGWNFCIFCGKSNRRRDSPP